MSNTVHTLQEADIWFRENHSGSVICVKPGASIDATCYPDAVAFFTPSATSVQDLRQAILAALRSEKPAHSPSLSNIENERVAMIYRRAVLAVCRAIEESAIYEELASTGVPLDELNPSHRIGEHLAATRRHFGLIP